MMKQQELPHDPDQLSARLHAWIPELKSHATRRALVQSAWYKQHGDEMAEVLGTVLAGGPQTVQAGNRDNIRCLSWNIEKGKRLPGLLSAFRTDPELSTVDIILLQEVDWGMARSGNCLVAREIAAVLNMNFAFAPCFIELTKGVGDDLDSSGENAVGLQGNAILSRFPIRHARMAALPQCFEPYEYGEKRFGSRVVLACDLEISARPLTVACTHLEVRNTPACRKRQMRHVLEFLDQKDNQPVILGGDFNTNTFARGTRWRTVSSLLRLALTQSKDLLHSTAFPETREPLFAVLHKAGFHWENLNDRLSTSSTKFRSLEEGRFFPRFIHERLLRSLAAYESGLPLRLDWFVGKNLDVMGMKSITSNDARKRVTAKTIEVLKDGRRVEELSDHRPIILEITLPAKG